MRQFFLIVPFMLIAAPAVAAPSPRAPAPEAPIAIPPELTDPAVADQLGRVAGVLAKSLMNLPVGEMEAAIEGRDPTPADRTRTVRDSVGDPDLDRRVSDEVARSGRTMQAAGKALAASLPSIMAAIDQARGELERAIGNMPDPYYPRR